MTSSITSLVVDPASPKTVYAAIKTCGFGDCSGQTLKTSDGGASWSELTFEGAITAMAIDPGNTQTLYAYYVGHHSAGARSLDGGSTWTDLSGFPNDEASSVSQLLVDPAPPTTIYAALCGLGLFASSDGGGTWTPRNHGLTDLCVLSLARDPGNSETWYAGTQAGIFKSVDRAMTWTPTGFTIDATALVVDPTNSAVIFAGTSQAGVFRSLDRGETWTSFNEGLRDLGINALVIDSAGEYLHAATSTGVFDLSLDRTRVVGFHGKEPTQLRP